MKKSIKLIFKIVAGALFLVVIVVSGMIMFLSFDRRDAFSIINADFTNYEYLKNSDLLRTSGTDKVALANRYNVYSHRLVEGSGIIIGYREYSNGSFFRIDDEYFSKLTIWIPELPKEFPETYNFSDVNSIKAIYTKGGSAWPGSASRREPSLSRNLSLNIIFCKAFCSLTCCLMRNKLDYRLSARASYIGC